MTAKSKTKTFGGEGALSVCLGLLTALSTSPSGFVDLDAFARDFDIDVDDVERAVTLLQSVADERSGARIALVREKRSISLLGDAGRLAPLRLTEDESIALAQALRRCRLDDDVRKRLDFALGPIAGGDHAERLLSGDTLLGGFYPTIAEALAIGARLLMRYRAVGQESPSERLIDPGYVEVSDDAAYLVAWNVEKDAQRSYRLDRIDHLELTDDSVVAHPFTRHSAEESLRTYGETATVRWPSAQAFESCPWAGINREHATELPDGCVEAPLSYTSREWLFDHILAAGGRIIITAPESLKHSLVAYARQNNR